jgi:hypothetical protein
MNRFGAPVPSLQKAAPLLLRVWSHRTRLRLSSRQHAVVPPANRSTSTAQRSAALFSRTEDAIVITPDQACGDICSALGGMSGSGCSGGIHADSRAAWVVHDFD